MDDAAVFKKGLERERLARKEAERLLEIKSRELFLTNQELRKVATNLREQAERYQTILDAAGDAIITVDEEGAVESFNHAAERTFGYSIDEVLGTSITRLVHHSAILAGPETWLELFVSDLRTQGEWFGVARHGTRFPIEISDSAVQLAGGTLYSLVLRDISRRRQLEARLAHAQKMESIGQMASGLAHMMNTPLQYMGDNIRFLKRAFHDLDNLVRAYERAIPAYASANTDSDVWQTVRESVDESDLEFLREEVPYAIQQCLEGTSVVAQVVSSMRDFSGPAPLSKTAIDLNQSINSVLLMGRKRWADVANIETSLDDQLPPAECSAGDILEVLLNLITNAARCNCRRAVNNIRWARNDYDPHAACGRLG